MKLTCDKCGYEGEMHQVGRILPTIKVLVLQCPRCCFLYDLILAEPMSGCKFVIPTHEKEGK